mmetsp:Transcript_63546/g.151561  ORF Transcript_63546/g.151561 Transcript_63546/m.151561 type:complete len:102 (-) Transcript_63546:881-1186(-)
MAASTSGSTSSTGSPFRIFILIGVAASTGIDGEDCLDLAADVDGQICVLLLLLQRLAGPCLGVFGVSLLASNASWRSSRGTVCLYKSRRHLLTGLQGVDTS